MRNPATHCRKLHDDNERRKAFGDRDARLSSGHVLFLPYLMARSTFPEPHDVSWSRDYFFTLFGHVCQTRLYMKLIILSQG